MSRASLIAHFRRRYGASPLHLAGHLVVFAIAAFALARIASAAGIAEVIGLYVGFIIAHDLIFLPLYSSLDRVMRRTLARVSGRWSAEVPVPGFRVCSPGWRTLSRADPGLWNTTPSA